MPLGDNTRKDIELIDDGGFMPLGDENYRKDSELINDFRKPTPSWEPKQKCPYRHLELIEKVEKQGICQ